MGIIFAKLYCDTNALFGKNLHLYNDFFICFSETWFPLDVQDSVYNLHGFKLFRSDRKVLINNIAIRAKGRGVAIYVRNGIPCKVRLLTEIGSRTEYLFHPPISIYEVQFTVRILILILIPSFRFNMTTLLLLVILI